MDFWHAGLRAIFGGIDRLVQQGNGLPGCMPQLAKPKAVLQSVKPLIGSSI